MIYGIGTDLVEIERIKKACMKEAFLVRCFTPREIELFEGNMVKAAGNFAVKEAVSKALGTGFRGFWPSDIEVLRDELGNPGSLCIMKPSGLHRRWALKNGMSPLQIQRNWPRLLL